MMVEWIKAVWAQVPNVVDRRRFHSCFMNLDCALAPWRHTDYGALFSTKHVGEDSAGDLISQLVASDAQDTGSAMD
ncbi:unnamed protein product [Phytophthora fragariaefolia]|uniref:Unnamed protein product n=1 Tax=Phytophthora fragariaefolia TaxID=1490495 RepID=A0A9W6XMA0_9STRA|nr:unnamed protein product [Phytophthora fragariaefolia]